MRRIYAIIALLIAVVAVGCIIGPKQDDPAEARDMTDAGSVLDVSMSGGSDSAPPSADTGITSGSDTAPFDSTDAAAEVSSEVGADGGDAGGSEAGDADASDAAEGG